MLEGRPMTSKPNSSVEFIVHVKNVAVNLLAPFASLPAERATAWPPGACASPPWTPAAPGLPGSKTRPAAGESPVLAPSPAAPPPVDDSDALAFLVFRFPIPIPPHPSPPPRVPLRSSSFLPPLLPITTSAQILTPC